MSRVKNASRNIVFGLINNIIILVFPFIIRIFIIRILGAEYLGLNGLFVSILQVLNLTELGFNSAIVYSMYKPIAKKDTKAICALVNLYKKIYRIIGLLIIIFGLMVLPFLNLLIKGDYPSDINIYILYILFLLNSGISYFLFAYKSALLTAHQRNDILSNIQSITCLLQYGLQVLVLIMFKNYYLFVVIQIITTIINNIIVALIAKRKYPDYICEGEIDIETKKSIKKRVKGLMINKICHASQNSLDSICISTFLGLETVAIYSNYYSIMHAIIVFMGIIYSSIVPGIGNSIVTETEEKNYKDMKKFNFIYMWLSGWCTISLACLFQPLMKVWMGEEYMFSYEIVILICLYFYSLKAGDIRYMYSEARGLWYENRYRAIIESIVNVTLNIILVRLIGVTGIVLGTLISFLVINFYYSAHILYKHYFVHQKILDYFKEHFLYAFVTFIICIITYAICELVKMEGIFELLFKGIICCIVPTLLYLLVYGRTKRFKEATELFKRFLFFRNKKENVV